MAFFPNPGLRGGSAEWEPQYAPEGQDMTVGRNPYAEFDHNLLLPEYPDAGPNKFMHPGQLPLAEEFRPHRALTPEEIVELRQPGGAERVAAQMRMEREAMDEITRRDALFDRRWGDGADLPLPRGGLPQTAPLPPRRPASIDPRLLAEELLRR
jgi:hypothetical protein